MSVQAMTWIFNQEIKPAAKKLVLLSIANASNEAGECWPSQKTIAAQTGCGVRTVRRYMAEAEAEGIIIRYERRRSDGTRSSDLIALNIQHVAKMAASGIKRPVTTYQAATGGHIKRPPTARHSIEPKDSRTVRETRARDIKVEFDEKFYPQYPHKVAKPAALKAFEKARKKASLREILDGLARYKKNKPPDISWAHPSTWLNQERWTDEPDNRPASRGSKSSQDKDWEIMQRL